MKRVAVIGLGSFGYNVVRRLYEQGAEVIAIDIDEDAVQACADTSHHAVVADATDKAALEALHISDVDVAVVSLGERMDVITLCSLHLKELGVARVATKAISDNHEKILKAIGVDEVIQPEKEAALRLGTRLSLSNIIAVLPMVSDDYSVVALHATEKLSGKRLGDLESASIQVVAIQSGDERRPKLIPSEDEIIQADSRLIILGADEEIREFTERYCRG